MIRFLCLLAVHSEHEWPVYYGAHCHWREETFKTFGAQNISQLLNLEPSIDHSEHYYTSIPSYFQSDLFPTWLDRNYEYLSPEEQEVAQTIAQEAAAIYAADAMCHPRARVGLFDWTDVRRLLLVLPSNPYAKLFERFQWIGKHVEF
jgi:hypothetical protein